MMRLKIGSTLPHGHADMSHLQGQGRGVIDAVFGDGHKLARTLQGLHDPDLLARFDSREDVGARNQCVHSGLDLLKREAG